jgi:hypothetical protein
MNRFLLYLAMRATDVQGTFLVVSFISLFIVVATIIIAGLFNTFGENRVKYILKYGIPILIITSLLAAFTPTTSDIAVVYTLPKVVNSEQLKEIPKKFLDLADKKLEDEINKIKIIKEKEVTVQIKEKKEE